MWKTFIAEIKHLFKNKWKFAGFIIMLFIPFMYGFLYLNAYWAPFKHVDKLHIAIVSKDELKKDGKNTIAGRLVDDITKHGITAGTKNIYTYHLESDQSIRNNPEEAVDSGEYSAVIIIPKGYSEELELASTFLIAATTDSGSYIDNIKKWEQENSLKLNKKEHVNLKNLAIKAKSNLKIPNSTLFDSISIGDIFEASSKDVATLNVSKSSLPLDRITFYNSYKHSYLAGEMTNYISSSLSLVIKTIDPLFYSDSTIIQKTFNLVKNK